MTHNVPVTEQQDIKDLHHHIDAEADGAVALTSTARRDFADMLESIGDGLIDLARLIGDWSRWIGYAMFDALLIAVAVQLLMTSRLIAPSLIPWFVAIMVYAMPFVAYPIEVRVRRHEDVTELIDTLHEHMIEFEHSANEKLDVLVRNV